MRRLRLPLLLLFLLACGAAPAFIDDEAGLLSADRVNRIRTLHRALLRDAGIHFHLTVLKDRAADLDAAAALLFKKHELGTSTGKARGVLFVIDPKGRQARLEIGYDLEMIFPDAFVGYIERDQMAPFFLANQPADGVEAAVELIVARALNRMDLSELRPNPAGAGLPRELSGGAGARIDLPGGQIHDDGAAGAVAAANRGARLSDDVEVPGGPAPAFPDNYPAGATPEDAFRTYLKAMADDVGDPELPVYSPDTRVFLRGRVMTAAQRRSEREALENAAGRRRVLVKDDRAVMRFEGNRQVPPYFFLRTEAGWTLDLAAMSRSITFNQLNEWRLKNRPAEYEFGLSR